MKTARARITKVRRRISPDIKGSPNGLIDNHSQKDLSVPYFEFYGSEEASTRCLKNMAKKQIIDYKKTPFKRFKDDTSQANTWSVIESLNSPTHSKRNTIAMQKQNQKGYNTP